MDKINLKFSDEVQTQDFAAQLSSCLKTGDVVALYGILGVGKSVLSRAVIRTMTGDPDMDVPSPTFTLVQTYEVGEDEIWHCDFYRLEDPSEVIELGWEDALQYGITLAEWPERITGFLPKNRLEIELSQDDNNPDARLCEIRFLGNWAQRAAEMKWMDEFA